MGGFIDFNDIVGKKIGKLTVLRYIGKQPSQKYYFANWSGLNLYPKYKVKCECGEESIVNRQSLFKKRTNKGCKHCSHKKYTSILRKTYQTWKGLNNSCNAKATNYYTANNIKVYKSWREDFENFLKDMGEKPKDKILIRINKKRNFSKSNCRWSTRKNSIKRQSNTNLVSINKHCKSLKSWFKFFKFTKGQYNYYVNKKGKKKSLREKFNLKDTDVIIEHHEIKR